MKLTYVTVNSSSFEKQEPDLLIHEYGHLKADSKAIREAYERFGTDCVHHLKGAFAFIVVDKIKKRVFGARDRVGTCPFYYTLLPSKLSVATNFSQIRRDHQHRLSIDEDALSRFLGDYYFDQESTFYRELRRLPPAHFFCWDADGFRVNRYWQMEPQEQLIYKTDDEYVDHFLELTERAMGRMFSPKKPSGILLSGGVDSSLLTAIANSQNAQFETFSLCCEQPLADIGSILDSVFNLGQWPQHQVPIDRCLAELEMQFSDAYADTCYLPGAFLFRPLYALARERGIESVMLGHGGDDVFFPGLQYVDWLKSGRWLKILGSLRSQVEPDTGPIRSVWLYGLLPILLGWRDKFAPSTPKPKNQFNKEWREIRHQATRRFHSLVQRHHYLRLFASGGYAFQFEQEQTLADVYGIKASFPYMDEDLITFAFKLPPRFWFFDNWSKYILRLAARRYLPSSVVFPVKEQDFLPYTKLALSRQRELIESWQSDSLAVAKGLMTEEKLKRICALTEPSDQLQSWLVVEKLLRMQGGEYEQRYQGEQELLL